jgi:hypothetical protein
MAHAVIDLHLPLSGCFRQKSKPAALVRASILIFCFFVFRAENQNLRIPHGGFVGIEKFHRHHCVFSDPTPTSWGEKFFMRYRQVISGSRQIYALRIFSSGGSGGVTEPSW